MRDIKFRVYSTQNVPKMIYLDPGKERFSSMDLLENEVWKVMQWTGLIDVNNRDVYEGDIVRDTVYGWIETVEIKVQSYGCGLFSGYHSYISEETQLEVIGNVWENKELLEGGKDEKEKDRLF